MNQQAYHTFDQIEASGEGTRPLDFPPPQVARGLRVNALVLHPESGTRIVVNVIHREDLTFEAQPVEKSTATSPGTRIRNREALAYWPQRRLQDAIYGSVWACLLLRVHFGVAACDDAARAAGFEPGSPDAPIVWEITGDHVAIKMVEWARVHHMRGQLLEDPVKEVAAMRMQGTDHPNVLGSSEVLQDEDFLYSVMPFCRGGDLFGVVVQYAEESNEETGMPEPVARYWFRQILSGLQHLQASGVCHRDLSLENVLVDGDVCKIIDMGMCLRVPFNDTDNPGAITDIINASRGGTTTPMRRLMLPQGVCGKRNYMSPEVFANVDCFDGFSIDLWSTGVILYTMLTGFPPYDQANSTDQRFELIITGHLTEQLRNWDINLSDEAGDLMQNMLQLRPSDRLTLAQILSHPWVVHDHVEPPPPPEPLRF